MTNALTFLSWILLLVSYAHSFSVPRPLPIDCDATTSRLLSTARSHATPQTKETLATSNLLGKVHRIHVPGADDGVVSKLGVPTFACCRGNDSDNNDRGGFPSPTHTPARGLEGALLHGPAFVVDNILSPTQCEDTIKTCESLGFGEYNAGKNYHGALQLVVDPSLAETVAQALSRHVDMHQVQERRLESEAKNGNVNVELTVAGLNRRWRVYKYQSNGQQQFCPHIDAGFPPSGLANNDTELIWDNNTAQSNIVSRLTVLLYLNDDFEGGQTNFFRPLVETPPAQPPQLIASVQPKTGSCLVFPQGVGEDAVEYARQHWPLHEGAPVTSGSAKYVIRSDILFATTTQERLLEDPQFCYDHLVRGAFLPQGSPVFDQKFLGMLESIYVPHMGVENLGHLLYSLIRFTKKRSIVEIGSGYTSPWILQALADNDAELKRIKELGVQARLLDYPWVDEMALDLCSQEPALLTTIDNCQHQKETATGAVAIAKQMGLNQYLDFVLGDAYEIAKTFDENSIDVLFCDFGVGSRMRDFVRGAWKSLRDGGFLICHSTLTNSRTREWLEAVRSRHTEDRTGLPVGEYVELSLLEPHKYFQNSFSVLQKRKAYEEPIHSEYA